MRDYLEIKTLLEKVHHIMKKKTIFCYDGGGEIILISNIDEPCKELITEKR